MIGKTKLMVVNACEKYLLIVNIIDFKTTGLIADISWLCNKIKETSHSGYVVQIYFWECTLSKLIIIILVSGNPRNFKMKFSWRRHFFKDNCILLIASNDYILFIVQFEENIWLNIIFAYKRPSHREGSLSCHPLGHGTSVYTVTSYDKPGLFLTQNPVS